MSEDQNKQEEYLRRIERLNKYYGIDRRSVPVNEFFCAVKMNGVDTYVVFFTVFGDKAFKGFRRGGVVFYDCDSDIFLLPVKNCIFLRKDYTA